MEVVIPEDGLERTSANASEENYCWRSHDVRSLAQIYLSLEMLAVL